MNWKPCQHWPHRFVILWYSTIVPYGALLTILTDAQWRPNRGEKPISVKDDSILIITGYVPNIVDNTPRQL